MLVVATKIDALSDEAQLKRLRQYCRRKKLPFLAISAVAGRPAGAGPATGRGVFDRPGEPGPAEPPRRSNHERQPVRGRAARRHPGRHVRSRAQRPPASWPGGGAPAGAGSKSTSWSATSPPHKLGRLSRPPCTALPWWPWPPGAARRGPLHPGVGAGDRGRLHHRHAGRFRAHLGLAAGQPDCVPGGRGLLAGLPSLEGGGPPDAGLPFPFRGRGPVSLPDLTPRPPPRGRAG